jgi:hypothetical protein
LEIWFVCFVPLYSCAVLRFYSGVFWSEGHFWWSNILFDLSMCCV